MPTFCVLAPEYDVLCHTAFSPSGCAISDVCRSLAEREERYGRIGEIRTLGEGRGTKVHLWRYYPPEDISFDVYHTLFIEICECAVSGKDVHLNTNVSKAYSREGQDAN